MPKKSQIQLDYEASFTPATASASLATLTLAAVTLGTWINMPWWFAGVLGAAAAAINIGHTISHHIKGTPHRVTTATAAAWAVWAAWAILILRVDPREWAAQIWWAAIASFLIGWVLTHLALDAADVRDEAQFAEDLANPHANQLSRLEHDRRRRQLADTWLGHIHTATRVHPTVTGLKEWPNDTGFSLELELPPGSRSDQFDTTACRQMAEAARLPVGCTVTTAPSKLQGHLILHVMLTDPATVATPYPNDLTRITINGGIPWVTSPLGEDITVELREACALIVGPPGTGKTTLMDAILAGFARCDDVLTWGIDIGKTGDAFVHWVDDLTPGVNRGLDWVAATRAEAMLMLEAAARIATTRLTAYRQTMATANTKLLPISPNIPMIQIVIDEGVHILGSNDPADQPLKRQILDIMETTRAMGIRLILTATDANVSAISDSRIRKYSSVRVALTATDHEGSSVQKMFGHIRGLDARQLRAKGSGVIDAGHGPRQCRTWVTTPSMAKDVTAATTTWRPTLDTASATAAGDTYTTRWAPERTTWIHGEPTTDTRPRNTGTTTETQAGTGLTLNLKVRNPDGSTGRRAYPHDEDATDERFADIIGNMQVSDPRKPAAPSLWERANQLKNEWRTAALALLNDDPTYWWSTSGILEALERRGIAVARQTLATELADLARRGVITTNGKGGAHTQYAGKMQDDR